MQFRPFLLPVVSFALGAGAWLGIRMAGGVNGSGGWLEKASGENRSGQPNRPSGKSSMLFSRGDSMAASLAFTGLREKPTIDDIFAATGLDQPLRIAIFLQSATSAEIGELLERMKNERVYDTALTDQIWLRWVEVDREAAFKANRGGTAAWWAWAKLDPQAALAGALAEGKPDSINEVIRSIGQGDQDAAIRLLSKYPETDTPMVWEGILSGIGKTDRAAAAALAVEKNLKMEEYVGSWVAREPEAALAWAKGLEDPTQRRRVLDLAMKERITADPKAALGELEQLPVGRARTERTAEAIAALARTDPAAAQAAAAGLANPTDRRLALSDLAETLAARDPKAALAILKDLTWQEPIKGSLTWTYESEHSALSGSNHQGTDHQAIRQLMQSVPEATASLLAALPPERKAPVTQAVQQWAAHQPEAASQWIQALPSGGTKDSAIQGLTEWLTQYNNPEPDYEAALAWGAAFSTPEMQFNSIHNTLSTWRNQDWKAARAAVDRLTLTPEQHEQLLQNFGVNPPSDP